MDYPLSPLPSDQIIEPLDLDALGATVPAAAAVSAACNNPLSSSGGNCFRDFVLSFWSSEPDAQADAEQFLCRLQSEKFFSMADLARFSQAYSAGRPIAKKLRERLTHNLCDLHQIKFEDMLRDSCKLASSPPPLRLKQAPTSPTATSATVTAAQLQHPSVIIDRHWFTACLHRWCAQASK